MMTEPMLPADPAPTAVQHAPRVSARRRTVLIVIAVIAIVAVVVALLVLRPWAQADEPAAAPTPTSFATPTPTPFPTPPDQAPVALSPDRTVSDTFADWRSRTTSPQVTLLASDEAHTGNYSLALRSAATAGTITGQYEHPVDLEAGRRYTVSAWVKSTGTANGAVEIRPGTGWEPVLRVPGGAYDWRQISVDIVPEGPAVSVRLIVQGPIEGLLIDEITITDDTGVAAFTSNTGFEQNSADLAITSPSLMFEQLATIPFTTTRSPDGWLSWSLLSGDDEVASGEELFTGNGAGVPLPRVSFGYYRLTVAAHIGGKVIERETSIGIVPTIPAEQRGQASRFGIHLHDLNTPERTGNMIDQLGAMGIGHVRADTVWASAERKPGEYSYPTQFVDNMNRLAQNGMTALQVPVYSNKNYDGGLTPSSPAGLAAYGAFTRNVLQQFPQVGADFEVYNEFDHFYNTGACGKTPECYISMLDAVNAAVDPAVPGANTVGPSLSGMGFKWEWLEQFFAQGGLDRLDAVTSHPYTQPLSAPSMGEDIERLRSMMREANNGQEKPIWITEMGWATMEDWVTEEEQAAWLVQVTAATLGHGAERLYWYEAADQRSNPVQGEVNMGLFRSDTAVLPLGNEPKPAAVAQVILASQIGGMESAEVEDLGKGLESYIFSGADTSSRVVWATDPDKPVTLELTSGAPIRVTDIYGETKSQRPKDGKLTITVTDSPVYIDAAVKVAPAS